MLIYFDNAATTKPSSAVIAEMVKSMEQGFGNPSSLHTLGLQAELDMRSASDTVLSFLAASSNKYEVVFTSGGTEANNLAIFGIARGHLRKGGHIILGATEHPSVRECASILTAQGFNVAFVPSDSKGQPDMDALASLLKKETILVSIMHVNNETGTVSDIADIGRMVHERSDALFHADCVQSYGKIEIPLSNVDLLSVSGHKIHSPKGIGCLIKKKSVVLTPLLCGGGQQKGLRVGTENIPGIMGLKAATQEINLNEDLCHVTKMYDVLVDGLRRIPDAHINGGGSPYVINVSFLGLRGEVLVHALAAEGIFISTSSACSSRQKAKVNEILQAMRVSREAIEGAVRISLCRDNNIEECRRFLESLDKQVNILSRGKSRRVGNKK